MGRGFVIIRLGGGLGNQMFQYAAALAVAMRTEQPLYFDLEPGTEENLLDVFQTRLEGPITPWLALRAGLSPLPGRTGTRFFSPLQRAVGVSLVKPRTFGQFDPEVLRIDGPVVLHGHWQSERYFADVAPVVRSHLSFETGVANDVREFAERLHFAPSVGMHIRRGDYLSMMPQDDLPTEYYYRAAYERVREVTRSTPTVYGFSDDPFFLHGVFRGWFPHAVPVSGSVTRDRYEEMALLSACQHQIIAPSSYSWWAAWLNPNPDKVVVAPSRWVYDWAAPDVVPTSWLRLPSR